MEPEAIRSGLTARTWIPKYYDPKTDGFLAIEGIDEELRPLTIQLNYSQACRLMKVLRVFCKEVKKYERIYTR